jgi:hypothetical protein
MEHNSKKWRVISGIIGFFLFLVITFTSFFVGLNTLAGVLQVMANVFVFVCWAKAYSRCHGFEKFVALLSVVFPPIMAGITIWRVLIPIVFK